MPRAGRICTAASTGCRFDFGGSRWSRPSAAGLRPMAKRSTADVHLQALAGGQAWRHSGCMKIGIIGAGAIGGWVAARLALAGNQVSVLARGATLDALQQGLSITEAGATQLVRVRASQDQVALGVQDVLVIAVKAPALAAAAESAAVMVGPDTLIVPMLNGVPWWFLDGAPLESIDPVSALTLATADRILTNDQLKPFILACMAEAAEIGAAIGCPIAESGEDRMAVTARLGAFKTSMLQDVEAGRTIELEALVGAPREIGRRVGIATPNIDTLYALTRTMAESRGLL